ncbi:MAG: 6-phosphogluconolactonase [Planctomycetota bacterium]
MIPIEYSLSPKITFFCFPKLPEMLFFLAERLKNLAEEEVQNKGFFSIALSGGQTPRQLYEKIAQYPISWNDWRIFFSDERAVPRNALNSNFSMAHQALLSLVPESSYFRISGELADLNQGALFYEKQLLQHLPLHPQTQIPQFDLILLGVGTDGHIASLFPNSPALLEEKRLVVSNPGPFYDRITFTFPLLNHAKQLWILTTGSEKALILNKVFQTYSQKKYPVQGLNPKEGHLYWFADQAATPNSETLHLE